MLFRSCFCACSLCVVSSQGGPGRGLTALAWLLTAAPRSGLPGATATAQNTSDLGLSHDGRQRYAHRAIQLALFANIIFAICQNAQKAHFYVVTFSIMATPNLLEEH